MTEEELKALKDKADKAEALEKERESLKGQLDNAQKLIGRWGDELGKKRSEVDEVLKELRTERDSDKMKQLLDKVAELEQAIKDGDGQKATPRKEKDGDGLRKSLEDIKSSMTADQQKAADEAFAKLAPEDRMSLASDEDEQKKFLLAAIEAKPQVPDSLFKRTNKGETAEDKWKKLFAGARVVAGSGSSASRFSGSEAEKVNSSSRRLPNGKIPRPANW